MDLQDGWSQGPSYDLRGVGHGLVDLSCNSLVSFDELI